MRLFTSALSFAALLAAGALASPVFAAQTAQSKSCAADAAAQHLSGKALTDFKAACKKGALVPKTPTASTGAGKEAKAITKPSGVDRTVRSKQCAEEADKRGLKDKDRKDFQLSCLATAGPVTEGGTHSQTPTPAPAIPGIGVNKKAPH